MYLLGSVSKAAVSIYCRGNSPHETVRLTDVSLAADIKAARDKGLSSCVFNSFWTITEVCDSDSDTVTDIYEYGHKATDNVFWDQWNYEKMDVIDLVSQHKPKRVIQKATLYLQLFICKHRLSKRTCQIVWATNSSNVACNLTVVCQQKRRQQHFIRVRLHDWHTVLTSWQKVFHARTKINKKKNVLCKLADFPASGLQTKKGNKASWGPLRTPDIKKKKAC